MSLPPPSNQNPVPNRTPFDDDLVANPNAPRHTQPLPAQQPAPVPVVPPASPAPQTPTNAQSSTQPTFTPTFTPTTPSPLPSGPSTFSGVPSSGVPTSGVPPLPRQVIPADDDAPVQTTTLSARRVPMSVIVGLAMVGGAIGVVMLSSAFGRLAPRPDSPGVITAEQEQSRNANQTATAPAALATPRVAVAPPRTSKPAANGQTDSDSTDSNSANADLTNPDDVSPDDASLDAPMPDVAEPGGQDGRGVRSGSGSNPNVATTPRRTNDTSNNRVSDNGAVDSDAPNDDTADSSTPRNQDLRSDSNRNLSRDNSGSANSGDNRSDNSAANDPAASPRDIEYSNQDVKPRYVERRRSYSIRPPSGFQIAQRGRRTVWQGPGKAQFLVEVGDAEGASPRQDWENLERGLRRKYGKRYRGYGIRETTINGRQAAIWEFELQTPAGRVRKVDVAVHDGKNGYAVLGSAPAEDFENYRPAFDRAIRSLQIDSSKSNDNSDSGQTDSSATAEGY